jgi:acyl carrier protein
MTRAEILQGLGELFARELAIRGPIDPGAELLRDLELDSLALLTLVVEVENRFRIVLDDAEAERVVTLADLAGLIQAQLARESAAG